MALKFSFVLIFRSKKTENLNDTKDTAINPAKLSRDKAPKPLLHLGPKWGKKPPPPSIENKDTAADKGDEWVNDGVTEQQVIIILVSEHHRTFYTLSLCFHESYALILGQ